MKSHPLTVSLEKDIVDQKDPNEQLPEGAPQATMLLDSIKSLVQSTPRPTWDTYFMAIAWLLSSRSPCHRLKVGCVLVSSGEQKNRIIAAGYNGFLPGAPHNSRIVISPTGQENEQATVHAEQNAIADAARRGTSVENATAYITHFPCIHCAKIIAAAGIRTIHYSDDYKNDPIVWEILKEAGVAVRKQG
jgi:dCMP deaminase